MALTQTRNWEQQPAEPFSVDAIARALTLDRHVGRVLVQRGLDTVEQAESFLYPSINQLHDPFLLTDLEVAVNRLLIAIEKRERIAIHGDYDVDGITATVLLQRLFELMGADVMHYIPHRMSDGYGLQVSGIDRLHEEGAKVVISVDCGIRSLDAASRAL